MDKKDVLKKITQFKDVLKKKGIEVEKIVLYGSWANGTHNEWSDVDLVVISRDFEDKDYWTRIEILSEAIYEVFKPIEAVAFTPQEWQRKESLICQYAQKGEVIKV